MGLQIWPPSRQPPPLSSMACLDVETPAICRGKFKSVLQLRLQQRRTREQLVEQGIMPPLKTPAAFHEQIRSLERARTGNFLKHKLCSRPERSELVRMHILPETQAEPSLQATQMKLKKARLADDLNGKIAQRPGPMELVVKNILPVDTAVEDTISDDKASLPQVLDVYSFDEDSIDALSPERPASQMSHSSSSASPREAEGAEAVSTSPCFSATMQHSPLTAQSTSDLPGLMSANEQQTNHLAATSQPVTTAGPSTRGPVLVKQSQPKTPSDKSRSKKSKEPKTRVKKLKYHQYIPPDQKRELNDVPMDSTYARLLQQQQQFLQLQILSQQQQHYNYQAILPAPLKSGAVGQNSCSNMVSSSGNGLSTPHTVSITSIASVRPNQTPTNYMPDNLPANLDEMKVAKLKTELKLRGLLVSGTKTDLIERLKSYQESANNQTAATMDSTAALRHSLSESIRLTPPMSPIASKVSSLGIEESSMVESQASSPVYASPIGNSPTGAQQEESRAEARTSEKDRRLHEKERQIEELMRKLEQEQRLVEELKMQLEVEKRSQQQGDSLPQPSPPALIQVKEENGSSSSNCSASCSPTHHLAAVTKEECPDQIHVSPPPPFIGGHQQPSRSLRQSQPGTCMLLSLSAVAIQLPENGIKLQVVANSAAPGSTRVPGAVPQKTEVSAVLQQQCTNHTRPTTQTDPLSSAPDSAFQFRADQDEAMEDTPQHLPNTAPGSGGPARASTSPGVPKRPVTTHKPPSQSQSSVILQQPKFTNHIPKCKDPPRYEDAIKQTRCMQTAIQVPTATSQHMDDLFDVLIESGEIAPFIRQDSPSLDKLLPVTASVTTLPINTVLSRPPHQVQVAQPPTPAPTPDPSPSLPTLATGSSLETLLEGVLVAGTGPRTLRLMEELHSQLLQHPSSPVETMELDFIDNTPPSAFHLQNTNLDNMDWLDLTMPVCTEGANPLAMSSPMGVFSSEFLDSQELQLSWD
ncbi:myocardin-related transcription factor B isoform X2 [Lampris incognitus]|uniref:myocardin-related transcription factor B isoform X2 n=1 Tax=Lampris incognitus TaxID=2546036 RepID=UPI0024B52DE0|nr:myocardin-related transcription factor B isoform X2 [Lampris incognitus]